jgi:hypothetical protein
MTRVVVTRQWELTHCLDHLQHWELGLLSEHVQQLEHCCAVVTADHSNASVT